MLMLSYQRATIKNVERGFHQQKWCMLMGFDGIIGIWGLLHMDVLGYNGIE